jgi:hypothetical protein
LLDFTKKYQERAFSVAAEGFFGGSGEALEWFAC